MLCKTFWRVTMPTRREPSSTGIIERPRPTSLLKALARVSPRCALSKREFITVCTELFQPCPAKARKGVAG